MMKHKWLYPQREFYTSPFIHLTLTVSKYSKGPLSTLRDGTTRLIFTINVLVWLAMVALR